jgi:hypothetical protein
MFNTINKHTPFYLQEMFSPSESVYNLIDSYGKLRMSQNHAHADSLKLAALL